MLDVSAVPVVEDVASDDPARAVVVSITTAPAVYVARTVTVSDAPSRVFTPLASFTVATYAAFVVALAATAAAGDVKVIDAGAPATVTVKRVVTSLAPGAASVASFVVFTHARNVYVHGRRFVVVPLCARLTVPLFRAAICAAVAPAPMCKPKATCPVGTAIGCAVSTGTAVVATRR